MSGKIVVTDGDNTLWDTNEVFAIAQKRMLAHLQAEGFACDPVSDFVLLRSLDDALIGHFRTHRYEPRYLAYSLMRHFGGTGSEGTNAMIAEFDRESVVTKELAIRLGDQMIQDVHAIPQLFPDALSFLVSIRDAAQHVLILYSDASSSRLGRILSAHALSGYFDRIVNGDKSEADWQRVWLEAQALGRERFPDSAGIQLYVIGDLLKADIAPANRLGATTFYKPGGYRGEEVPESPAERPTFVIRSLVEVIAHL